jgi:hypothetical protein
LPSLFPPSAFQVKLPFLSRCFSWVVAFLPPVLRIRGGRCSFRGKRRRGERRRHLLDERTKERRRRRGVCSNRSTGDGYRRRVSQMLAHPLVTSAPSASGAVRKQEKKKKRDKSAAGRAGRLSGERGRAWETQKLLSILCLTPLFVRGGSRSDFEGKRGKGAYCSCPARRHLLDASCTTTTSVGVPSARLARRKPC